MTISPGNSGSIAQESGEIRTAPRLLQPISFKSDRLLGLARICAASGVTPSGLPPRYDFIKRRPLGAILINGMI
ncbi:MAG: hypothetical protein M3Q00_00140, partial [Pseudomonadota bacterium]|nr:hypothetical protein [Pseudomonadota bacterium]